MKEFIIIIIVVLLPMVVRNQIIRKYRQYKKNNSDN